MSGWWKLAFILVGGFPLLGFLGYVGISEKGLAGWRAEKSLHYIGFHLIEVNTKLNERLKGVEKGAIKVDGYETPMIGTDSRLSWWGYLFSSPPPIEPKYQLPDSGKEKAKTNNQEWEGGIEVKAIDLGPVISDVLKSNTDGFILVDGMKGIGKTTAMILLCSHLIQKGYPAYFLQFSKPNSTNTQNKKSPKTALNYLLDDPEQIDYLACYYGSINRPVAYVIDDFHIFMKECFASEKDKGLPNQLLSLFRKSTTSGARVIFTTSDYGMKDAILKLPGFQSLRINEFRCLPPPTDVLKEMINDGLKQLHAKLNIANEGDSAVYVDMYCETVGVYREVLSHYIAFVSPDIHSVKDVVKMVLEGEIERVYENLQSYVNVENHEHVKVILDKLCRGEVFTIKNLIEKQICLELQGLNLIRFVSKSKKMVEFNSYSTEVAIRALRNIPASPIQGVTGNRVLGLGGRGSANVLKFIKSEVDTDIENSQATVKELLKTGKM